jgi:hypothetical protein
MSKQEIEGFKAIPGPYVIDPDEDGEGILYGANGQVPICRFWDYTDFPCADKQDQQRHFFELIATQRLFVEKLNAPAPAPHRELVEAAKKARDFVGNLNTTDHPDAVEIYEDLAAAVAKCEEKS